MLRLPVKICLIIASVIVLILGIHGLFAYSNPLEMILNEKLPRMLFLEVKLPEQIQGPVLWMSRMGYQDWIIPVGFIIVSITLFYLQTRIESYTFSKWLRKSRLW